MFIINKNLWYTAFTVGPFGHGLTSAFIPINLVFGVFYSFPTQQPFSSNTVGTSCPSLTLPSLKARDSWFNKSTYFRFLALSKTEVVLSPSVTFRAPHDSCISTKFALIETLASNTALSSSYKDFTYSQVRN